MSSSPITARCSLSDQITERRTSSASVTLPTTMLPRASGLRMRSSASHEPMSSQRNVPATTASRLRSEEHTSELQSRLHLVCRLLLEKKKSDDRGSSRSRELCDLLRSAQQTDA